MQLLILVVVLTVTGLSHACTCPANVSTQEKYCKADFAVLVKVQDNGRVIGMNRVYKIKLEATYKSNVYEPVNKRYIYTATNSAACGVMLQRGSYYILTGYYQRIGRNRRMKIGLCDFQQRFDFNPVTVYMPPSCNGIYRPDDLMSA